MAVPVEDDRLRVRLRRRREAQVARIDRLDEQLLGEPHAFGDGPRRLGARELDVLLAQRHQAGRLEADDRDATLRERQQPLLQVERALPRIVEQPLRHRRATAAALAHQVHAIARELEQLDARASDADLGEARERVGEHDDVPARCRRGGCAAAREPAWERLALEHGRGPSVVDADDGLDEAA